MDDEISDWQKNNRARHNARMAKYHRDQTIAACCYLAATVGVVVLFVAPSLWLLAGIAVSYVFAVTFEDGL